MKRIEISPGECPPTLEKVLETCKGKIFCNLEAKCCRPLLVDLMVQLIDKYHMWDDCMVSSFEHEYMNMFIDQSNG